jgi:2-polyprenyl-3-methyl-5-hydroxy-6-metoxy-1,4-benzoquinol methylase
MAFVNCNLCGADDFTVVFKKGEAQLHQIVRCNLCGLMYANPQEEIDAVTALTGDVPTVYNPEDHREYFQKQQVQIPDNLRALSVLNEYLPGRGRLLEVGSYCGIFLDRIRSDGWEATGLEPFRAAADYSRAKFGLQIMDGVLPQPELPDRSFDAVVMLHVIEHMPDPMASLRELRRLLRPGGLLVVETPRFDSLVFKLLGKRERSVAACNGHIYFFTVPTLTRMLEQSGFQVERADLVGRTLTLERLLTNVAIVSRSDQLRRAFSRLSQALRLDRLRMHINARDMQRLYCRAV